uniref:Uncharacterized protein n=1 Tax=Trypanosoma congolense (strain IL3000) TaxID=1068625 RepID=G0UN34_TRYCI|nr:conserved hypothetical protein [Trypanosoma congolense IL3000]
MDSDSVHDARMSSSQKSLSPDLDACWRRVLWLIASDEGDHSMYRAIRQQTPVYVYIKPTAWRRLVQKRGACYAVELMLSLGFVPAPEGVASLRRWLECDCAPVGTRNTANTVGDSGNDVADFKSFILPAATSEEPGGGRGIRFQVIRHGEVSFPSGCTPLGCTVPSTSLEWDERFTSSTPFEAVDRGGGVRSTCGPADCFLAQASSSGVTFGKGYRFEGDEERVPSEKEESHPQLPHLEAHMKELRRHVQFFKLDELSSSNRSDPTDHVPSSQPQLSPVLRTLLPLQHRLQEPRTIDHHGFPLAASTRYQTPLWLSVSHLDPDCAPYVISLGTGSGRTLLACTIVEHRFVFFVAPPRRCGLRPVALLCTRDGNLRPYAGPVWLEHRAHDPPNTLTHHAVNQLLQDIPLPTSAISVDAANLSEAEAAKSESCFDDDNTGCETDTAATGSELGFESEPHLPLTKEMLRFIQNTTLPAATPNRRFVAVSESNSTATVVAVEVDRDGEDICDDDGDGAAPAPASQLWRVSTQADMFGSPMLSTERLTSCVHGTCSGRSDGDATFCAFPCTELSSSSATSLWSHESAVSAAAGIMTRRGWVRPPQ